MEIPAALEGRVQKVLDLVNRKLLNADPRLAEIAQTLTGATRIAAHHRDGKVDLWLVPLKSWDLLSKAGINRQNMADWSWLPLKRHGQGVQSLSVIFLFQVFVPERADQIARWRLWHSTSLPKLKSQNLFAVIYSVDFQVETPTGSITRFA